MKLFDRIHIPRVTDAEIGRALEIVERSFDSVERAFQRLTSQFLITNRYIEVSIPDSVDTKILHGLGRIPRGWRIIDQKTGGDPERVAWDATSITLNINWFAVSSSVIRLEVF